MRRTLSLAREALAELTADDLAGVVGAQGDTPVQSVPVSGCIQTRVCLTRGDSCINC